MAHPADEAEGSAPHEGDSGLGRETEILKRLGGERKSAARMGRKAAEAEQVMGFHGVSVTAGETGAPCSSAARKIVEDHFRVHDTPTRREPLHRTVDLPKPVTQGVADLFNRLFGRGSWL
jgi:hypothetical protein